MGDSGESQALAPRKNRGNIVILLACFFATVPAAAAPLLPESGKPAPVYSLNDCLQLALDRNPDILKAQRNIERTQGLIITAKAALFPQVNLNGRLEERNDDVFAQGGDDNSQRFRDFWAVQLQISQSLYSGGINRQQIAIAKLTREAALIQLQATIDQVLRQVKYAIYALVIDQAQIEAETQTIQLLTQEESRQRALFDAGRTTRFNVLRTQVSLGNQRSYLTQNQNDLTGAQIALSQLLNIEWPRQKSPLQPPFRVHENLETPPLEHLKVDDLVALALSRRPELQVIDRQIDIAQRQIKIDKAATLPRIDAFAAAEERRDQSQSSFDSSINDYGIGLLGTWNIFDGFASKGQAISDTAALNSTQVSRDALRLRVQNEVLEAYARMLAAEQTIQSQGANVKIAEESVKLAQVSAETGYATLLDVLQATLDLTSARTQSIKARQLYLQAQADLELAVSLKFVDWPGVASSTSPPAAPAFPPSEVPMDALRPPSPP